MKLKTQETKGLPFVCRVEILYTTLQADRFSESLCGDCCLDWDFQKEKERESLEVIFQFSSLTHNNRKETTDPNLLTTPASDWTAGALWGRGL